MRHHLRFAVILFISLFALSACADEGSASDAIEDYLKAKVESNEDKLVKLSCNEWESQAMLDAASFESVKAEIQDMSCKENGKDGDYTLVTCEGKIVVEYRAETREFNLSDTTYLAQKEDGEWKMCGEQAN
ncbi:MAG: hypothetical protein JW966_03370 [Anaerolineae bacterium]|nr:hypothetical protein [Anaerolineae bacterium]